MTVLAQLEATEAKEHLRAVLASRPWSDYEAWQAARRWLTSVDEHTGTNEPGCVDCGQPLHPHGNGLRECRNPDCAMYARGLDISGRDEWAALPYRCECTDSPAASVGFQCRDCGVSAHRQTAQEAALWAVLRNIGRICGDIDIPSADIGPLVEDALPGRVKLS